MQTLRTNPVAPQWRQDGERYIIAGARYTLALSARDGSILSLFGTGSRTPLLRSGEYGLWLIRFRSGATLSSHGLVAQARMQGNRLMLMYQHPQVDVSVRVVARQEGVEFFAELTPRTEPVLDFSLPARLRFDPAQLRRMICPMDGNQSVGAAFLRSFFERQSSQRPSAWQSVMVGPDGYARLFGGALLQRPDNDPPVTIRTTDEARNWLSEQTRARIDSTQAIINRPSAPQQLDIVLVSSPNGACFGARRVGAGYLWRFGGRVEERQKAIVLALVSGVLEKLSSSDTRWHIGVLALDGAPRQGGWAAVTVDEWIASLQNLEAVRSKRMEVVEIRDIASLMKALRERTFLAVINPYGEWLPVPSQDDFAATLEAIRRYAQDGGSWFEVGGYPFYYALQPAPYFAMRVPYPPAFADFLHWEMLSDDVSLYRIQPRMWKPWDRQRIFVPGWLAWGGDEQGGYAERAFGTYVAPGESWRAPVVRLTMGDQAPQALQAYAQANGVRRRLSQKMPRAMLDKFKRAILVYYAGNAREKIQFLNLLPVPSLVHFADYLKGGFDKEYPDHLPPHPQFGTVEELSHFIREAKRLGHLVMPYTNPTWWCDDPKGPTFQQEGDAPLLRTLEGNLSRERYGQNEGYTICFWHPAVQRANRRLRQQFSEQLRVDILFQDQCGARSWLYDTNPASPTPYAYTEGLLSMVAEDSAIVPLSTESGWDHVAEHQVQLCGMAWSLVPTQFAPEWRKLLREQYPPDTWQVFALAQLLAHDKTAMIMHDLGQFVTNREVLAWVLGLGFGISARISAPALVQDAPREWLRWLSRLQQSVCARYIGEPLRSFAHERVGKGDGILRADYGTIKVVANLNATPQRVRIDGAIRELAPYGFYAVAKGMIAANLHRLGTTALGGEGASFVVEQHGSRGHLWVYDRGGSKLAVEWLTRTPAKLRVRWDNGVVDETAARGGVLPITLPERPSSAGIAPPRALARRAPREWRPKPSIGVVELPGVKPSWTSITSEEWLHALQASRAVREWGAPLERLRSVQEVFQALGEGANRWFAIINPYGEVFPVLGRGHWGEMLERIRRYVQNGGVWWETAGYSFFTACYPAGNGYQYETVGPAGMSRLGLPIGSGAVEQPAEPLKVSTEAAKWLGDLLSQRVARMRSTVNRGLPRSEDVPEHFALVSGERDDFIGGYRLGGWGWLWRVGGFHPNPEVVLPVATAALDYLYANAPLLPLASRTRFLWHAVITSR